MPYAVGIDIGSTATKVAVMQGRTLVKTLLYQTGFSGAVIAQTIFDDLRELGFAPEECSIVGTGYGRVAVSYARKTFTEISCHGLGAFYLFEADGVVIDIGGQDTKIILLEQGKVARFLMNDKCSAGTGKFLEVMANRLGLTQEELSSLAQTGRPTEISSLCTVFAESEIISLIGQGAARADIANGVIESVVSKVAAQASTFLGDRYYVTGGLCENEYLLKRLEARLEKPVKSTPLARYAGAIGAALQAARLPREEDDEDRSGEGASLG